MSYRQDTPTTSTSKPRATVGSSSKLTKRAPDTVDSVLFLKQNHAKFKAPTRAEFVFFDECNREIISLTSGIETTKTRVIFQSTDDNVRIEFLLPVEKKILSIKLNSTRSILAYHVERNIIEFVNVRHQSDSDGQQKYVLEDKRYVQSSRAKNSKLIGFLWTGPMDLVIITDLSVEYCQVDPVRRRLKHIKMFQSATNWFVYQPPCNLQPLNNAEVPDTNAEPYSVLMVSTGSLGNSMQPYMFMPGQIFRLHRFDVEGCWHGSDKLELFERSITIAHIYGFIRLLVLQHESLNVKSRGAQILIYTVDPESGITMKTHTLDLDVSGRFAINILDNLVVVHDQPSKSSFIFDINIESTEKSDCPKHFVSLLDKKPIRQLQLDGGGKNPEMYSLNWVFFQPNFIIDAKLGLLSTLNLDLGAIQKTVQDNLLLLSFLANRRNSEHIILKECKKIVADAHGQVSSTDQSELMNPLAEVSSVFEILGKLVISSPELERTESSGNKAKPKSIVPLKSSQSFYGASLYQEDIQREVFKQLESVDNDTPAHFHFVSSALLEFIFVVRRLEKNVEFCIYEQLIKCIVKNKRFFQVVQMIRSEIFKDSKQMACLLLSMRAQYRPAAQLGLDMLHRLDCLTGLVESMDLSGDTMAASTPTSTRSSTQLSQSVEIDAKN